MGKFTDYIRDPAQENFLLYGGSGGYCYRSQGNGSLDNYGHSTGDGNGAGEYFGNREGRSPMYLAVSYPVHLIQYWK